LRCAAIPRLPHLHSSLYRRDQCAAGRSAQRQRLGQGGVGGRDHHRGRVLRVRALSHRAAAARPLDRFLMFELLGTALVSMMQVKYLVPLFIGSLIGVVGGALPGITITMTVIVVLPFTFGLEPLQGLACMIGVYVGGETGGLITSCLLGIPGKPSAVATTFDGFPMARKGEPGRALWLGIWASILGGLLGAVVLVAATGPLAQIA